MARQSANIRAMPGIKDGEGSDAATKPHPRCHMVLILKAFAIGRDAPTFGSPRQTDEEPPVFHPHQNRYLAFCVVVSTEHIRNWGSCRSGSLQCSRHDSSPGKKWKVMPSDAAVQSNE